MANSLPGLTARRRGAVGWSVLLVILLAAGLAVAAFGANHRQAGPVTRSQIQLRPVLTSMMPLLSSSSADASPPPAPALSPAAPGAQPRDASDPAWITPEIAAQFTAGVCPAADVGVSPDPARPLFGCGPDGERFVLGPAEVAGPDAIDAAVAEESVSSPGYWAVHLSFRPAQTDTLASMTERLTQLPDPRNRMAILRGQSVLGAPRVASVLTTGQVQVVGDFTQSAAESLARSVQP